MALKDWKSVETRKDSLSFVNKKTDEYIDIYLVENRDLPNYWRIDLPNDISKKTSNKRLALGYARAYMRKH
ncbi:MAG: hypothetical protein AABY22_08720 [Nanoarchaeota archaeon]